MIRVLLVDDSPSVRAVLKRFFRKTRDIEVQRTFADFDDFWATSLMSGNIGSIVAAISAGDAERLKTRVYARLPADEAGHITYAGRANAVKGCVPK